MPNPPPTPNVNNIDPNATAAGSGAVAAGGNNNTLGQTPPPKYPDWLLQTDRGIAYDYDRFVAQDGSSKNVIKLYRLRNTFGATQNNQSSSNAVAYLLLVSAQISLWETFLTEKYPTRAATDPFPGQSDFSTYCLGTTSGEYLHAKHGAGGAHAHGSAIDVEYVRSPYIPMWNGNRSAAIYDHDSYKELSTTDATAVAGKAIALWDKICGGTSPSAPKIALDPGETTYTAWLDQMVDFNDKVKGWFAAGGKGTADDRAAFQAAVPQGYTRGSNGSFKPDVPREPAQGVMGFTKDLALGLVGATVSDIDDIPEFSDGTLQSTLKTYSFRWGPFVFGPDIQHFDIGRIGSTNLTKVPIADIHLAEKAIEAALKARPSAALSGIGPWTPAT